MSYEFPSASYDAWKTRAPEDEAYWYGFDDENGRGEYECECCFDSGWDWENVIDEQGREIALLVPCGCRSCYQPCPDIEDLYERERPAS